MVRPDARPPAPAPEGGSLPDAAAVDLSVQLGPMRLANPIMPASGTFSENLARVMDLDRLGAFVAKSIYATPRKGNPTPRVAETREGMLNSIGLPSKGVAHFVAEHLPAYAGLKPPLVVSLSADTVAEFGPAAAEISVPGVGAIEVNISCPNLEADGRAFAQFPDATYAAMSAVRAATSLPIWAKLTPNVADIAAIAQAAEAAGADALVVANTILAMAIDVETRRPRLGNVMGGYSGPAVKPIMLRMAFQCARAVRIPVIGCGGIVTVEDVAEYLIAGCSAVQVGTQTFLEPGAMPRLIDELARWCAARGIGRVRDLVGTVRLDPDPSHAEWLAS
ncbi:MAG: dihydroorotate dehydrogenase [Alphaproteobacteria bacterium]|nr:dihydroorotate dehydrogenase [Alphaproteobacteria bacterium]